MREKTTVEHIDIIASTISKTRASYVERLCASTKDEHDRLAGTIAGLERALAIVADGRRDFIDGTVLDEDGADEVRIHVL